MGLFKKKDKYLKAFTSGKIIPITEVPDEVFAQKMMGDGIAIYPDNNIIVAPCDGKITAIMENTEHAVGITLANGVELLIHVGLDTVNLTEKIFSVKVAKESYVHTGEELITFDKVRLKELGYQDITMLVILDTGNTKKLEILSETEAIINQTNIIKYLD